VQSNIKFIKQNLKKRIMVDAETKLCISIAERQGNFGARFHNACYQALGLNYIYVPRQVSASELAAAIEGIRALKIAGCSVSMPHKEAVLQHLDLLSPRAKDIGAVNTIVQHADGKLMGYNTDYSGAKIAIEKTADIKDRDVLMIGAGGVAKAVGVAVIELGGRLRIANRTLSKARNLAEKLDCEYIEWDGSWRGLEGLNGYMFINATSIGMYKIAEPLNVGAILAGFEVVQDVVVDGSLLMHAAEEQGLKRIPGLHMAVYQAVRQVALYTSHQAPQSIIDKMLAGEI